MAILTCSGTALPLGISICLFAATEEFGGAEVALSLLTTRFVSRMADGLIALADNLEECDAFRDYRPLY
jgi:hypothetical protein